MSLHEAPHPLPAWAAIMKRFADFLPPGVAHVQVDLQLGGASDVSRLQRRTALLVAGGGLHNLELLRLSEYCRTLKRGTTTQAVSLLRHGVFGSSNG